MVHLPRILVAGLLSTILTTTTAQALDPVAAFGSTAKTGHSILCTEALATSIKKRAAPIDYALGLDWKGLKGVLDKHHSKIRKMTAEQFQEHVSSQAKEVMMCHPKAGELLDKTAPGVNYFSPFEALANLPGSIDRKVTYSLWVYDYLYRRLYEKRVQLRNLLEQHRHAGTYGQADAQHEEDLKKVDEQLEKIRLLLPHKPETSPGQAPEEAPKSVIKERVVESISNLKEKWQEVKHRRAERAAPADSKVRVYVLQDRTLSLYILSHEKAKAYAKAPGMGHACYEKHADLPYYVRMLLDGRSRITSTSRLLDDTEIDTIQKRFEALSKKTATHGFYLAASNGVMLGAEDAVQLSLRSCLDAQNVVPPSSEALFNGLTSGHVFQFEPRTDQWLKFKKELAQNFTD